MLIENKGDWRTFIDDGDRFLKTAINGAKKRKNVFTSDIIFNIISMAIEKHIMGYLLFNGRLPDNHTMGDLVDAVRKIDPIGEDGLYEKLQKMDRFQEICCIDQYSRKIPEDSDIREFLITGRKVRDFVMDQLGSEPSN